MYIQSFAGRRPLKSREADGRPSKRKREREIAIKNNKNLRILLAPGKVYIYVYILHSLQTLINTFFSDKAVHKTLLD